MFIKNILKYNKKYYSTDNFNFVPKHQPLLNGDIEKLKDFFKLWNKILIITGAGISTESGLPDYRSEDVGLYARTNHRPITHQEFLNSELIRKRYWARNYVGWSRFSNAQPNNAHYCIQKLEIIYKKLIGIITQNVDGLHYKAGSKNVIELHGTSFRVVCLNCGSYFSRDHIQNKLNNKNSHIKTINNMIRPDGDVDIPNNIIENFQLPYCENCNNGILKPDVIFFGDNIPKSRIDIVRNLVSACDAILVLGSSLSVYSAYRIILQGIDEGKPFGIVNIGPTRADDLASLKITARCSDILLKILEIF